MGSTLMFRYFTKHFGMIVVSIIMIFLVAGCSTMKLKSSGSGLDESSTTYSENPTFYDSQFQETHKATNTTKTAKKTL